MKLHYYLIIILLSTLVVSCSNSDCPEDRYLGVLGYSESSLSFTAVTRCSLLTFKNYRGNQIQLIKEHELEFNSPKECIKTAECNDTWLSLGRSHSCDYIIRKDIIWRYSSDSVNIRYELSFKFLEASSYESGDTSLFVESFSAAYVPALSRSGTIELVSGLRGKEYSSRKDSLRKNDYVVIPEKRFWDTTLYNLYSDNEVMWLNKESGIVAFEFQDDLYRLVDCE